MYLFKKSMNIHVRKYHIIWASSIYWNDIQEMRKNPICRPVFNLYQNSISKHTMSYRNTCMKWSRYRSIVRFSWIRRVNHDSQAHSIIFWKWGGGGADSFKKSCVCEFKKTLCCAKKGGGAANVKSVKKLIVEVKMKICMHVTLVRRERGSFCLSIPPPPSFKLKKNV